AESAQHTGASCFFKTCTYPELTLLRIQMVVCSYEAAKRFVPNGQEAQKHLCASASEPPPGVSSAPAGSHTAPTALSVRSAQRGSWGWTRAAVSVPGRQVEASGEAPLHVLTGSHLTASQHGPGGTEPALRAAAWPMSLPTQPVTVIVVDDRAWHVLCNTTSAA